jgi:putative transposase
MTARWEFIHQEKRNKRSGSTWDEFVSRHPASLWQADFLGQKILTVNGIREAFILVFLHVETRRVIFSPATLHPNEMWMTAQAASFLKQARDSGLRVRHVQHDRDCKFTDTFDEALRRKWAKVVRSPRMATDCQTFVERFIGSLRGECLSHFVFFGTQHLDGVAACYRNHYLEERPHQGKGNELLHRPSKQRGEPADDIALSLSDIRCHRRLGGLLKHCTRRAA